MPLRGPKRAFSNACQGLPVGLAFLFGLHASKYTVAGDGCVFMVADKSRKCEAHTRVSKFLFIGAFGFTFTPWRYRGMKANSSFVRKAGRK